MSPFLVWQWPDGCVVFDQATGHTHAFDPSVAGAFLAAHQAGQGAVDMRAVFDAMVCASQAQGSADDAPDSAHPAPAAGPAVTR